MATYFMFGKYSADSIKQISAQRTKDAIALVGKNGGKINGAYILMGEHDLVLIVDLPGNEQAIKTSVALAKLLGVTFATAPAVTGEEFDKLVG